MKNIYQTITAVIEEIPAIGKTKRNTTQNFMFRGIDDVMNTMQPLFAKHKLFIVPEVLEQIREERQTSKGGTLIYSICKIKYTFFAEDGTHIEAITIGEGMDSGDKATNKATAIAMKYAMFQVFCIPTEEMKDPDSETPEPSRKKTTITKNTTQDVANNSTNDLKIQNSQIEILNKAYTGDNMKKLLEINKLEKLEDMTMVKASEIIRKLKELANKGDK